MKLEKLEKLEDPDDLMDLEFWMTRNSRSA